MLYAAIAKEPACSLVRSKVEQVKSGDTVAISFSRGMTGQMLRSWLEVIQRVKGQGGIVVAHLGHGAGLSAMACATAACITLVDHDFKPDATGDALSVIDEALATTMAGRWVDCALRNTKQGLDALFSEGLAEMAVGFGDWMSAREIAEPVNRLNFSDRGMEPDSVFSFSA